MLLLAVRKTCQKGARGGGEGAMPKTFNFNNKKNYKKYNFSSCCLYLSCQILSFGIFCMLLVTVILVVTVVGAISLISNSKI